MGPGMDVLQNTGGFLLVFTRLFRTFAIENKEGKSVNPQQGMAGQDSPAMEDGPGGLPDIE